MATLVFSSLPCARSVGAATAAAASSVKRRRLRDVLVMGNLSLVLFLLGMHARLSAMLRRRIGTIPCGFSRSSIEKSAEANSRTPLEVPAAQEDAEVGEERECPDRGARSRQAGDVHRDVDDAQRDEEDRQDVDARLRRTELVSDDDGTDEEGQRLETVRLRRVGAGVPALLARQP